MSKVIFAMNPRLKNSTTGEIEKKYNRGYAEPGTAEQISAMLKRDDLPTMLSEIRDEGKEEVKDQLPTICPHYSQFRNNHRAQADIVPESFTFKTCNDIDEKSLVEQAIKRALEVNEDEMSDFQGMVEYIDYSPRKKCHIWLRMPVGKTIEETQKAFCEEIGVPYDESCTTPERYINMTGDEVYRSERWLQPLTDEEVEERREAFLLRGLDVDGRPLKKPETASAPTAQVQSGTTEVVAADDRSRFIVKECLKKAGLTVNDLTEEGGRHNAVKSILSVGATQLLTKSEFLGVMQEMTPTYYKEKECQQLVTDFYGKYTDNAQKLTQFQRRVFAASRKINTAKSAAQADDQETEAPAVIYGNTASLSEIYASPVPPRINRKQLPRLVKAVNSCTPDENVECVSQACFPSLQAHPEGFSARYIDNRYRQLRNGCVTVVDTGIGKSCVDNPIDHIMADIQVVTAEERKKETAYHQNYNTRNSNLDKPKRPKFRIRNLMADLTPAALVLRTADNAPAPLYCKMNELEQWDKVESASGKKNQFTVMKLNDDEGNQFGAERAGTQSVTAATSLFLNWNASTTPSKLIQYMRHVATDGPVSRLTLGTIPDPGIAAGCPVFGDYDESYDAALKPFIDNLNAATGQIDCRQARQMIMKLKAECDEFAIASGDRVFDNLTHRGLVHVFRKAICIYAANGMKWEKAIEGFCRWSLHYDLWLKLHFFGDLIRYADSQVKTSSRGPANLLEQIQKDEQGRFNYNAVVVARLKNGMEEKGTGNMISQWVRRKLITKLDKDCYQIVDKKNDR